jgi:hypothetical protein
MANKSNSAQGGVLLAFGLGALVGAALSGGTIDRRAASLRRIGDGLAIAGIKVINGEVGRDRDRSIWVLTVEVPGRGVLTFNAPLDRGQDPHAISTCDAVAERVRNRIQLNVG